MTEQESVAETVSVSPVPSENKRKLDDLEPQRTHPEDVNGNSNVESVADVKGDGVFDSDAMEAKRPRLDEKPEKENGHKVDNASGLDADKDEETPVEMFKIVGDEEKLVEANLGSEEQPSEGVHEMEKVDNAQEPNPDEGNKENTDDKQPPCKEDPKLDGTVKSAEDQIQPPTAEAVQEDGSEAQEKTSAHSHTVSRKMEVPNNKVGVLIGKAGDTIRYLQMNSGAKIQITRDAEADPRAPTRPVEILGSLESIEKAEKLINDVITEADAGGAPSLVARGIAMAQAAAAAEQIQMHVPNDKVGMIIGKGGETIKYLQTTSGARIQLIPQHLPEGDQSKERIVRISGDKKQIEIAREMIMEVMTQPMRQSPRFGGYNQQIDRFHGASGSWGPRGGHYGQPSGYDYHQQVRPPAFGHYPGPHYGPRGGYGSGWQQQPPMQRPPYDNYARSGHFMDGSAGARGPVPSQAIHNYGQPHNADYGHPSQYPPAPSGYGQGYDEMRYGTQAPAQHPYGGQGNAQSGYYQAHPGQQYGKPAPYAMPPAAPQTYGPPRPIQPEAPYQASVQQPYSQNNALPQQLAPYVSGATDGYVQPASRGMQPGSYASYPSSQPGYPDQSSATGAVYGYQATTTATDPNAVYSAAPQSSQLTYSQPFQPATHDQSVPQ